MNIITSLVFLNMLMLVTRTEAADENISEWMTSDKKRSRSATQPTPMLIVFDDTTNRRRVPSDGVKRNAKKNETIKVKSSRVEDPPIVLLLDSQHLSGVNLDAVKERREMLPEKASKADDVSTNILNLIKINEIFGKYFKDENQTASCNTSSKPLKEKYKSLLYSW